MGRRCAQRCVMMHWKSLLRVCLYLQHEDSGTARRGPSGGKGDPAFRTAALARRADADSTSSTARRRNVASAAVRNACLEPFSVRLHKERARRQYEPIRRARSDAVQAAEKGSKCLGMEQGYLSESSVSHPAYG